MRAPTTTAAAKQIVDSMLEKYEQELTLLAEAIRQEHIIPACRRNKWTFDSGMGTFSFYDRRGTPIDDEKVARIVGDYIIDVLNIEVCGNQYLGFYVNAVN
jgi:hypothetical protein